MSRSKDITGLSFGELTALRPTEKRKWGFVVWFCECSCGGHKEVPLTQLMRKQTQSCGCVKSLSPKNFKPEGDAARYRLFSKYKSAAQRRGLEWELTEEQFLDYTHKNCFYCGSSPSTETNYGANGEVVYNGIDRVDNSLGYTQDNCVSCCKDCNYLKGSFSLIDFTRIIGKISNRLNLAI